MNTTFRKFVIIAALDAAVAYIKAKGGTIDSSMQNDLDNLLDRLFELMQEEKKGNR